MLQKFILFLLALTSFSASAVTFDVDGLRYNILSQQDKTVEVAIIPKSISYPSYSTYVGAFNIPSTVTFNNVTYDVIGIGDHAFSECHNLEGVTLPASIKHIGFGAFSNSNIEELILPEGVESVGAAAFYNCYNLTELCFPSTVTSLGENMFYKCAKLKKITISANNLEAIPNQFLNTCTGITEINIPTSVTSLGDGAFFMTSSLEEINIPSGVTYIGAGCFQRSGVKELVIPDKVTELTGNMFTGCSNLCSVKLPSSLTELSKSMFSGCTSLTSISIPQNVTFIPSRCFSGCYELSNISFPPYLKYIGDDAFNNCKSLRVVYIPEGTEIIYAQAFYGCSIDDLKLPSTLKEVGGWSFGLGNIVELSLPVSLNKIGSYAFDDCVLDKVICLNPTPANCEENAFKNETYYGTLVVPSGSGDLYKSTKPWSNFFTIEEDRSSEIADIFSDSDLIPISYTNLLGISQDRPFHGINLVRYSNGDTKKIIF